MGNMDEHSGNVTPTSFLHHLRDLWKSPRGAVFRIEFLAGVAIITAFLLAAFGSFRRWSNRWIVQKGFFAAHAIWLSLGTYSIGLMQTSPVKSEMYPIWTVSLFTLFGCIDPVITYNGHDYKGILSKVVFDISLNCVYVLLMSNSAVFSDTGNSHTAINVLAAITFMKSFHRSLALVQQCKMRKRVQDSEGIYGGMDSTGLTNHRNILSIDFNPHRADKYGNRYDIRIEHVKGGLGDHINEQRNKSCFNACLAFALSHKLQWHVLGLGYPSGADPESGTDTIDDYKWALKVIEIELALLYDIFFTGYPFLHYYQAKAASLWALASFFGICFVGIAAVTPSPSRPTSVSPAVGCTDIVDTTALDLVFTFVILGPIAILQLTHLIQGWTSIWARCAVAWAYGLKYWEEHRHGRDVPLPERTRPCWWTCWMRLKAYVATSTNWFNKNLWQEKMGQYSILPGAMRGPTEGGGPSERTRMPYSCLNKIFYRLIYLRVFCPLIKMVGVHYVWNVLWDLFGKDTNKGATTVRLDNNVKESIVQFLSDIVETKNRLDGNWLLLPDQHPLFRFHLVYFHEGPLNYKNGLAKWKEAGRYTSCVTMWHTATWQCEQVGLKLEELLITAGTAAEEREKNRRVANVLSKYCIYLVVSAPELLPGLATETKHAKALFARKVAYPQDNECLDTAYKSGMAIARHLLGDEVPPDQDDLTRRFDKLWETLALVWVRLLVYAAPYGKVEAHMRHLAQGGEFITHLWALLYHLDIRQWKPPEANNVHEITTIQEAREIDTKDDIVVAYFFSHRDMLQKFRDGFVTTSRMIDGVKFYMTSSPDVAMSLRLPLDTWKWSAKHMGVRVHNKFDNTTAFSDFHVDEWDDPYRVAHFVYETMQAWAKARAQEGATSTSRNPIDSDREAGTQLARQTRGVVDIEEEILQPPPPS